MKDQKQHVSKSILELDDFEEPPPLNGTALPFHVAGTALISSNITENSLSFRERFFPDASLHNWNDWRWQVRNSITSFDALGKILNLSADELGFTMQALNLPVRITPY